MTTETTPPAKCGHDPREMAGQPIGMFHCPECGEMVIAGMPHPDYSEDPEWPRAPAEEAGHWDLLSVLNS